MTSLFDQRNAQLATITPFSFEGFSVRTIQIDGQPWFVAADVCGVLDLDDTSKACSRLDDDERGTNTVRTPSGDQQMLIINESGLYSLILTSRKPNAKSFKRWVTGEVLPSIRKTGSYGVQTRPAELSRMEILTLALDSEKRAVEAETQLAIAAPKADALDRIADAEGSMCITDAAKHLQMQPKRLFSWLAANDWIYRRPGNANWIAYQPRLKSGVLDHKVTTVERGDGSEKVVAQVLVTAKGLAKLAVVFGEVVA